MRSRDSQTRHGRGPRVILPFKVKRGEWDYGNLSGHRYRIPSDESETLKLTIIIIIITYRSDIWKNKKNFFQTISIFKFF